MTYSITLSISHETTFGFLSDIITQHNLTITSYNLTTSTGNPDLTFSSTSIKNLQNLIREIYPNPDFYIEKIIKN